MSKYLNIDSKQNPLPALGKTKALVADGAEIISPPSKWEENLVCVADNGFFECAAYCYSEQEMQDFAYPDGRPKQWLRYKHAKTLAN